MRVDVLTWDTEEHRHKVIGRDDIANLERMYYHVFKNVLRERWPDGSPWKLCPDEHTALDWSSVEDYLVIAGSETEIHKGLFTKGGFRLRLREEFRIEEIAPCKSSDEPLVQAADLFVGLAVYSYEKYDAYEEWLRTTTPQAGLFPPDSDQVVALSRSDQERCRVLKEFDANCKRLKLGVSLKTNRGLRTFKPVNPINFWLYEVQHEDDKAPVKEG